MKYTSEYNEKDFKNNILPRYILSLITLGPLMSIMGYTMYLSFSNESETRSRGIMFFINGIKQMSSSEITTALLLGIPLSFILTGLIYLMHNHKRIITEFEFDNEKLYISSRKINTNELQRNEFLTKNISFVESEKIYDAMAMQPYKGFELKSENGKHIGYLIDNHFSWNSEQYNSIVKFWNENYS